MLPGALGETVRGLFSICAAAATMELLVGDGGQAPSFHSLCALAAAVCAARTLAEFLNF